MRARNRKTAVSAAVAMAIGGASLACRQAVAANDLWTGNFSINLADSGNWSATGNAPPVTADSLEFAAAGTSGTTLSDNLMTPSTYTLAGITFDATAPAYVINPLTSGTNGFTLGGGITNNGTSLETINDLITLTGTTDSVTSDAGGGNIALGGNISGTGTVTIGGSGTVTLSGANTYSGATILKAGTLLVVGSSALSTSSTELVLGGNTTLALEANTSSTFRPAGGGNTQTTGIVEALTSDGPFNFSAGNSDGMTTGATLTLGDFGDFGPAGTAPTFNFAVNNNYTLLIGEGSSANLLLQSYNNATINSTVAGGTLKLEGIQGNHSGNYYTIFGGVGNIASGIIGNGSSVMFINEEGPGTTTLTAVNTYTGASSVYAGTLDFASNTPDTGISALNVYNGTMIADYKGGASANIVDGSDVLTLGGSTGAFEVNGAASSTTTQTLASLTVSGAGAINMVNNGAANTGLTFTSGTITHNTGGSVNFVEPASGTSITLGSATTAAGGVLAPYAFFTGGSNIETYAALSSGVVGAATLTAAASGANSFTSATANYSYTSPGATDTLTASAAAFTADFNTGSPQAISLGTSNFNLSINGILNTGGALTVQNGSGGTGSVVIPTTTGGNTELVIGGSASVTLSAAVTGTGGILSNDNTGTLTLGGANTYTGASNFNAGTTSLASTGSITGGGAITVGYGAAFAEASGASISGASSLTSNGTSIALAGNNTFTGNTAINTGILTVTGTLAPASGTTSTFTIGNTIGLGAAVYQSGASIVHDTSTGGGGFQIGSTAGAFGYYNLSGGTINVGGEIDPGGSGGGAGTFGELDMSGGTINLPAIAGTYFLPDRGGNNEASVVNISGGTVQIAGSATETASAINGLTANWGNGGQDAQISISGTGSFITPSLLVKLNDDGAASAGGTNVGVLNLGTGTTGGTLQTLGFGTAINQATPAGNINAVLNFNGGTLKAGTAANTSFLTGLGAVNVYSGGGTIDNNSLNITIAEGLTGASGTGVSSVALVSGGSGYITPPQVLFTGGTTVGGLAANAATGYATINPTTGAVSGIVITNPGSYTSTAGLVVGLMNQNGGATPATLGALTTSGNTSGGIIFQGTGTTTLSGTSTYAGATAINAGAVKLTGALGNTATTVGNGTNAVYLTATGNGSTTGMIGGAVSVAADAAIDFSKDGATSTAQKLGVGGLTLTTATSPTAATASTLTFNLTGSGSDSILSSGPLTVGSTGQAIVNLGGSTTAGVYLLAQYSSQTGQAATGTTGSGFTIGAGGTLGTGASPNSGPFVLGTVPGGLDTFTLDDTATQLLVQVSGTSTPASAYWSGAYASTAGGNSNWGGYNPSPVVTNWSDSTGTVDAGQMPSATSDVIFSAAQSGNGSNGTSGASLAGQAITANLDQAFSINSLTVNSTPGVVTVGGTGALTLVAGGSVSGGQGYSAGTGIVMNTGAVGLTISTTGGVVVGANQSWTNNSSGTLSVSSGVTATGSGATLTLANTSSGGTTLGGAIANGSGGTLALTVNNSGSGVTTIGGADTYTGATTISAGTVTLNGSLSGTAISNAGAFNESSSGALLGASSFTNTGTATLAGTTNFYTGLTTVNAGVVNVTGVINPTLSGAQGEILIGNVASTSGELALNGGTLNGGAFSDVVGAASGASGVLVVNSGSTLNTNGNQLWLGASGAAAQNPFGALLMNGGTATIGNWLALARSSVAGGAARGEIVMTGGTLNVTLNDLTIGSIDNVITDTNVATVSGGSINTTNTTGGEGSVFVGENQNGVLNMMPGTEQITASGPLYDPGTTTAAGGITIARTQPTETGIVNLDGGTINTTLVQAGVGTAIFNFNGGTLKATVASTTFMTGLSNAYVYSGGGTIDNGGNNITIGQALVAPAGYGVSASGLAVSGSGYLAPPIVDISGGTGTGATAIANVDGNGNLTGITVTNPGSGYSSGDTPTITLTGGGGTYSVTGGSLSTSANVSGGMVFQGSGTTTLSGKSTYSGATTIAAGTVALPAPLSATPVASYSFNNITDSSGNPITPGTGATLNAGDIVVNSGSGGAAMNGTVNANDEGGSSGLSTVSGGVFGGSAVNFDGGGTSVDVPSQIINQSKASSWTMSAWIQSPLSGSAILSKNSGGSDNWQTGNEVLYLGTNPVSGSGGNLPTLYQDGSTILQGNPSPTNVQDNNWHMVTIVDNAGVQSVYVDGTSVPLTQSGIGATDTSTEVRIGFNADVTAGTHGDTNFAGNMDDLQFYGSALSPGAIQSLYTTNAVNNVSTQYLPATTALNITASGAALNLNGETQQIASLAGVAGSGVQLGSGNLIVGGVNTSTTFAGSITGTGGLQMTGPGTLALSGVNTYSGGTSVTGGELIIQPTSPTTSALPTGALSISGSGLAQLAPNVTAGSDIGPSPASNVNLTSLGISGNGKLDITNNHIIIDYNGAANDPIASIAALIASGYNGGTWTGIGIMSTMAQSNPSYGIGYADAADVGNPAGLSSGQIEIAYTLLGDANLDYKVNGADFTLMAANFNDSVTAGWDKGDFNYSNTVNGDDFVLLADNFNQFASQSAVSAADLTALDDFAAANGISLSGVSSVPEPASIGMLAAGTIGVLSRRRRRK